MGRSSRRSFDPSRSRPYRYRFRRGRHSRVRRPGQEGHARTQGFRGAGQAEHNGVGCAERRAPAPAHVSEQEKALRERVDAYWKNRSASNLHACYPFYEASFRNQYTPDKFATDFRRLSRFAPEFMGIDAASIDPLGAKATVKVKLRTHPDVLQGQELISTVEETWVLEDGVWSKTGELTFPNI